MMNSGARNPNAAGGPSWMSTSPPTKTPKPDASTSEEAVSNSASDLQEIKGRIHRQLLDRLNLASGY